MKLNKKTLTNAILLLAAAGVFVLIGKNTDWDKTIASVKTANPFWVLASAAIMVGAHWLRAFRWNMLTEPAGYKLNTRRSFYSVLAGYLVNVATSRGGEVARCALTAKSEKAPLDLLVGTVFTERIIDVLCLALFGLLTLALQFQYVFGFFDTYIFTPVSNLLSLKNIAIILVILIAIVAVFLWFRKRKKSAPGTDQKSGIMGILARFSEGVKSVFRLKKPFLFLLISLTIWSSYWVAGFCVLQSLGVTNHLSLLNALSLLVFSAVGISIPLPAGAGVWYVVSFGLSTVYGLPKEDAETFGVFNLAFSNLTMIIVGSVAYLLLWLEMEKTPAEA